MDRNHPRHNAKARQATGGSRKKGKRRTKSAVAPGEPEQDSNALIIVPKSEAEKELDRREILKQEVCSHVVETSNILPNDRLPQLIAQSESKVNSKKKKRLEKYIVRVESSLSFLELSYARPVL